MRFRLWTLLWVFALIASGMASFGAMGLCIGIIVLALLWKLFYRRHKGLSLTFILTCTALLGTVVGLSMPAVVNSSSYRSTTWGMTRFCQWNLEKIYRSVSTYHLKNGNFPAPLVMGDNGKPWHSWRYLCRLIDLDQYLYDQPWDSLANINTIKTSFGPICRCRKSKSDLAETNYFAVVDERAAWHPKRGRKLEEFEDGNEQTILLVESASKSVVWTKPEDLTFQEALELLTSKLDEEAGHHFDNRYFHKPSHGVNVVMADGNICFLQLPISQEDAVALLTIDGGEELSVDYIRTLARPKLDYAKIYSLSTFVILSLLPVMKFCRIVRNQKDLLALTLP